MFMLPLKNLARKGLRIYTRFVLCCGLVSTDFTDIFQGGIMIIVIRLSKLQWSNPDKHELMNDIDPL